MQHNEETIYAHGNVRVTRSRLIIGSTVYAIRNITIARGLEKYPGILGRLLGQTPTYIIMLSTSSGEINAYEGKDRVAAEDLLEAIETAIAQN